MEEMARARPGEGQGAATHPPWWAPSHQLHSAPPASPDSLTWGFSVVPWHRCGWLTTGHW